MIKQISVIVLSSVILTGCLSTNSMNPNTMSYKETQSILSIKRGVVIAVEQTMVEIEGSDGVAVVSGIAGGLVGSQLSDGSGRDVAIGMGALAGGLAGKMLSAKSELSYVYTIEQQNGKLIQVIQTGAEIAQGSKVLVRYFTNNRKTVSVDTSQGLIFSTAKKTIYKEKAAAEKVRAAQKAKAHKSNHAKQAKQDAINDEIQRLQMESRKLNLESQKLDVRKKTIRVDSEQDFINSELKREDSKTGMLNNVGGAIKSLTADDSPLFQ